MNLTISFTDGRTEEVSPTPGDLVRFERQYGIAASKLDDDPRIEHVMFIAWCALKRTGRESREFDEFLDDLAEIGGDDKSPPAPPPV